MRIDDAVDRIARARICAPVPRLAHQRAVWLVDRLIESGGPPVALPAITSGIAELLGAVAADLVAHPPEFERLIADLSEQIGGSPLLLARELLRSQGVRELPVDRALEVQVGLLAALSATDRLSLWRPDPATGAAQLVGGVGRAGAELAPAADRALHGDEAGDSPPGAPAGRDGELAVHRIGPAHAPAGALVLGPSGIGDGELALLVSAAGPELASLLERRRDLEREAQREAVTGAVQRRLARLRFDLHDGPQQDVMLLAQDLRLFRDQLRPIVATAPDGGRVMGRLDDLEAQLLALDGDLRRLSTAVESPFLATGTLREALGELARAFAARTGLEPQMRLAGDLVSLSESQQIAILALVREALSNVRRHSDAEEVAITVAADPGGVTVEVRDDGSGFDPATTVERAARTGHLGLVGMHERVRMLGGRTEISSRPGGPTIVAAVLPPLGGAAEPT